MGRRGKYRRGDVAGRLKTVELFAPLAEDQLRILAGRGRLRRWSAGRVVFRVGDPADKVHLICEGSLEVVRPTPIHPDPTPVAVLRAGELIGDISLLTGTSRRSLGRIREDALLWTLEKEAFLEATADVEGYGLALARIYAHRLEAWIERLRRQHPDEGMTGHLDQVDLPTVIQTLVTTRQTGVLAVADRRGRNVAQVILVDGEILRARCGDLEGEEAFYEVFLREEPGEFLFRTKRVPDAASVSRRPIDRPAMSLLMEAMRRIDEVQRLRSLLPAGDTPLGAADDGQGDPDASTGDLGRALLRRLQSPRPLRDAIREVDGSTYRLYGVAARLYENGHIR